MKYKLVYNKKSADPYYYIQFGIRDGEKVKTHTVCKLGKHSELLKVHANPLEYAESILKEYNESGKLGISSITTTVDYNEPLSESTDKVPTPSCVNAGYLYLQKIYKDLDMKSFFDEIQKKYKSTYNFNDVNRFLTFARILDPKSTFGTYDNLDTYLEKPKIEYQHCERFLDVLEENYENYIERLYKNSENIVKRDTSVCYYDVTNYYFEIEKPDEDTIDPITNTIISGFRKYGINKQHQPLPQVQMGLFMDKQGIPLNMTLTAGNENECLSTLPLENKLIRMLKNKKIIYCSDAGLGSTNIRIANSMNGRAFIVTQSLKKVSDNIKNIILNDDDYKVLSTNEPITKENLLKKYDLHKNDKNFNSYDFIAYKIINISKLVDLGLKEEKKCKSGKTKEIKGKTNFDQILIVTFSCKSYYYQKHILDNQVERATTIIKNSKDPESIKKGNNDVRRFIKNTAEIKTYTLDKQLISEEEKFEGYYGIATNLDADDNEQINDFVKRVLEINSKRYKIEECFRIMKTNFNSRPVYHRTKPKITAHFLICYTALLIYRLLEVKLKNNGNNYSIDEIITTLKNIQVENCMDIYYESKYNNGEIISSLENICQLELNKKRIEIKRMKKILKNLNS